MTKENDLRAEISMLREQLIEARYYNSKNYIIRVLKDLLADIESCDFSGKVELEDIRDIFKDYISEYRD